MSVNTSQSVSAVSTPSGSFRLAPRHGARQRTADIQAHLYLHVPTQQRVPVSSPVDRKTDRIRSDRIFTVIQCMMTFGFKLWFFLIRLSGPWRSYNRCKLTRFSSYYVAPLAPTSLCRLHLVHGRPKAFDGASAVRRFPGEAEPAFDCLFLYFQQQCRTYVDYH